MTAYKGFSKTLTCRGFQYEEGKSYEEPNANLCSTGFHACERPLDCFSYYSPAESVYHEVELDDVSEQTGSDTKRVGKKIKIGVALDIAGLCKAQFEYVKSHTTMEHTDEKQATAGERGAATAGPYGAATAGERGAATAGTCGAATAGERGAATAGEHGAATAGERGAATAGRCGAATAGERGAATAGERGAATSRGKSSVGEQGIACARGNGCRVRGGLGAVLVIAEETAPSYDIAAWKAVVVDGKTVKADTWYRITNGELVEQEESESE